MIEYKSASDVATILEWEGDLLSAVEHLDAEEIDPKEEKLVTLWAEAQELASEVRWVQQQIQEIVWG